MRILKHEDVLVRLVKKYNKGEWDEDLMQEAWLTAIKCEQANPDIDDNELLGKVITWVKNRLIDVQTKKQVPTESLPEEWDLKDNKSYETVIFETRECLRGVEREIFDMAYDGKTAVEIAEKVGLSKSKIYEVFDKIKRILRG